MFASGRKSTLAQMIDYLRLMRASNFLTAVANILMGFLLALGSWQPVSLLGLLVLASIAFYLSGMVLNDVFDFEVDRRERPERPLPSGIIKVERARVLGFSLLASGVLLAWAVVAYRCWADPIAGIVPENSLPALTITGVVGTVLAMLIVGYNAGLKKTIVGPFVMGACRSANIMLAGSLAASSTNTWMGIDTVVWQVAIAIGIYIAGITWFARYEHTKSGRGVLWMGFLLMILGLVGLAWSLAFVAERFSAAPTPNLLGWGMLGLIAFPLVRRCSGALRQPGPETIQRAVVVCLMTMIMLDAVVCYFTLPSHPLYGIGVALLLVPTVFFGRVINPT